MGLNKFEWHILQDQYSEDALQLLAKYSDLTFEKVMNSINYLEKRTNKLLEYIKCEFNIFRIIGIKVPDNSNIDLLDSNSINAISNIDLGGYKSYSHSKEYDIDKSYEVFRLIESGYKVVDEKGFNQLNYLRKTYLN